MKTIKDLAPQNVWSCFDALTQVPRPSGHLEKVQQFLLDFGKKVGVETFKDEAGNIIMRKPASAGMENRQMAILQAHMDMVPQKTKESAHNFETDPIQTIVDGDWLRANGTTLGADDGLGVAAIMAIMEDKSLKHGPLEALITADEETGMYGTFGLKEDTLKGDILLNLDTEDEGEMIIGCAGGCDVTASLEYKEVETDSKDVAVKVTLKGLRGGHSGIEICEGRANANKLMVRFVREAIASYEARLASWNGGNMRNAIPRDCEVVLTIPAENKEELLGLVDYCKNLFTEEYKGIEENISFSAEEIALPAVEVPEEIQDNLVDAIFACHDGVVRNIPSMPDPIPGESWEYPEFKGYFAGISWMQLTTTEGKVGMETLNGKVGVYTPRDGRDHILYDLPETGISLLKVIPAVRNKVNTTDLNGPTAQPYWSKGKGSISALLKFE